MNIGKGRYAPLHLIESDSLSEQEISFLKKISGRDLTCSSVDSEAESFVEKYINMIYDLSSEEAQMRPSFHSVIHVDHGINAPLSGPYDFVFHIFY
jgi:hypothetical protein